MNKNTEIIDKGVPFGINIPSIIVDLQRFTSTYNLVQHSFAPQGLEEFENYLELSIKMRLSGDFDDIWSFHCNDIGFTPGLPLGYYRLGYNSPRGVFVLKKTVGLISLGCDKNTVDSEYMLGTLRKHGHLITNRAEEAEVIIVNTCGFIESAKQESIDALLEMAEYKHSGKCEYLIATGCLVQRYKRQLQIAMPELDALVGTGDFERIGDIVDHLPETGVHITDNSCFLDYDLGHRVRIYPHIAFVKIAEGCDMACSYCAIPMIKGPYKSRRIEKIREEVEGLVSDGVKEIVLVAQDTTNYGQDIYGLPVLPRLLRELDSIKGDFIIRIMYTYPSHIDDELLDAIASSQKIAPYLDMPLQHSNHRILGLMRRPARDDFTRRLLDNIRTNYPNIVLRTTFIVGFPTETDDEYEELLDFIDHYEFERVGAFSYSREEGTHAAGLKPQVPKAKRKRRLRRLMYCQSKISRRNNERLVGRNLRVLIENFDHKSGLFIGRSKREAPFVDGVVKFTGSAKVGDFTEVRILKAEDYDLIGKEVEGLS